jgi:hypothetical protein
MAEGPGAAAAVPLVAAVSLVAAVAAVPLVAAVSLVAAVAAAVMKDLAGMERLRHARSRMRRKDTDE